MLTAAFLLRANWRIIVASVMVCIALSILALAQWTKHAATAPHIRTPSNQQLLTWYWITIGIQLASLLPIVLAVTFSESAAYRCGYSVAYSSSSTLPLTRYGASATPTSPSVQASHHLPLPPIRHLKQIWREALCYTLATVGGLLFCRSRDWRLQRHAWQSILIDMVAIWAFVPLALVVFLAEELHLPPRPALVT